MSKAPSKASQHFCVKCGSNYAPEGSLCLHCRYEPDKLADTSPHNSQGAETDASKNAMFQFATTYSGMFGQTKIHEDTDLITLDEAKEMYRHNLSQFIRELEEGHSPEMVIWIDCEDNSSYGTSLVWIDNSYETDGKRIWKTKRDYVDEI